MKLVISYLIESELGIRYNMSLPIEYQNEKILLIDFEEKLMNAKENNKYNFSFGEEEFNVEYFIYTKISYNKKTNKYDETEIKTLPKILTLEEWFQQNKIYP